MTTAIGFILVSLLSVLMLAVAARDWKRILITFVPWAAVSAVLALSGFYADTSGIPPRIIAILVPSVVIVVYLYRSLSQKKTRLAWLIAVHIVRIPVELILHRLFLEGQIPELMTYTGWNFDIASGISAAVILVLHLTGKLTVNVLRIWNWSALLLLIFIVFIAILSVPTELQQLAFDRPNVAVLYFPFTWLPAVVVPIVFLSHFLIFRKLKEEGL